MVPSGFVWLAMVKLAVGPSQDVRGWLQISWLSPELEVAWACGACWVNVGALAGSNSAVPEVGRGKGVLLGGGVRLGVSVGGMGVAVGAAPSVSATIVNAAASAVCWISTGSTVGMAWGAQALTSSMNTTPKIGTVRFIYEDSLSIDRLRLG